MMGREIWIQVSGITQAKKVAELSRHFSLCEGDEVFLSFIMDTDADHSFAD